MSRGKGNNPQGWREWIALAKTAHYNNPPKIFSKTFEKPLDKCHDLWYNINVRGKDNKLYFKTTTLTFKERKGTWRGEKSPCKASLLQTEVMRSLSADSQSHKRWEQHCSVRRALGIEISRPKTTHNP